MTEYRITFKKKGSNVEYTLPFTRVKRKPPKKFTPLEKDLYNASRIEKLRIIKKMEAKYTLIKIEELTQITKSVTKRRKT